MEMTVKEHKHLKQGRVQAGLHWITSLRQGKSLGEAVRRQKNKKKEGKKNSLEGEGEEQRGKETLVGEKKNIRLGFWVARKEKREGKWGKLMGEKRLLMVLDMVNNCSWEFSGTRTQRLQARGEPRSTPWMHFIHWWWGDQTLPSNTGMHRLQPNPMLP